MKILIPRGENLSSLRMGSDPESRGLPTHVIDGGIVKHYVGIGWVEERPATEGDYYSIPEVVEVKWGEICTHVCSCGEEFQFILEPSGEWSQDLCNDCCYRLLRNLWAE